MLLDSSGTLAFGLPPDHAICQEILFYMPAISNEKAEADATEPEHDKDSDTDTTLTNSTTGICAGSVLESKFGDQARAGDVLTAIILHRRQQQSSLEGRQHQQEKANLMEHSHNRCTGQHAVEHNSLLLVEMICN
jgi:hypothetical protein